MDERELNLSKTRTRKWILYMFAYLNPTIIFGGS
jgi:hypothetical protein